jgi:mono/diheme cytochrome c family protein
MGFTCAACHTSQINYNGVGIRIDGGPGEADMDGFMNALADSLEATLKDGAKKQRFETAVLKAGNYRNSADVDADLKTFALRMKAYNFFNESVAKDPKGDEIPVRYGYSRLDAFGRIYNRVLEHVLNTKALEDVLSGAIGLEQANALQKELKLKPLLTAEDRDQVELQLMSLLSQDQQRALRNQLFNSPNAPVSYPFVWDIPQHDFVQWNGIGANAGAGPLGRNTGEVIGVFATLDWEETERGMPAPLTSWLGLGPKNISFRSSAQQHNLLQIEDRLTSLQAPAWEDAVQQAGLPAIDASRKVRGEALFGARCASCHQVIDRTDPGRRIVAVMDGLDVAGTDPAMASNSVRDLGFSGILRNQYAKTDVGSVLLNTQAPVAALLIKATENVVATPDPDKFFITRWADWLVDLIRSIHENQIKTSVKSGNYTPDTTDAPFSSLLAYKGRALDGIWATAPYLHNGSVPTLYDLLLPAGPANDKKDKNGKEIADPPGTVYRPKRFMVGSRELDPVKVGFKSNPDDYHGAVPGFLFDTSLPGNSNAGHDYGTRGLSEQDRMDLVEYLKTL